MDGARSWAWRRWPSNCRSTATVAPKPRPTSPTRADVSRISHGRSITGVPQLTAIIRLPKIRGCSIELLGCVMSDLTAQIHTDGAARGNPGPAAWAYVIEIPGRTAIEAAELVGTATNNVAEYLALIRALEHAAKLGVRRLAIFSD